MATAIIKPDGYESGTGFDQTGTALTGRINDGDTGTGVTQNNTTANFVITMGNNSAYAGGTINSIQLSISAGSSGRGTPTITGKILDGTNSDADLQSDTLVFSSTTTLTGTAYSTSLSPTIVDGLKVSIEPDSTGCAISEVFITVDYTAATTPFVGMKSGKYKIVSGKIKI
jgi:hypothetical protein